MLISRPLLAQLEQALARFNLMMITDARYEAESWTLAVDVMQYTDDLEGPDDGSVSTMLIFLPHRGELHVSVVSEWSRREKRLEGAR